VVKKTKQSAACQTTSEQSGADHTIKQPVAGQQRLVKQQLSKQFAVKQERWTPQLPVKLTSNQLLVKQLVKSVADLKAATPIHNSC
jgi:hypothetical protein